MGIAAVDFRARESKRKGSVGKTGKTNYRCHSLKDTGLTIGLTSISYT